MLLMRGMFRKQGLGVDLLADLGRTIVLKRTPPPPPKKVNYLRQVLEYHCGRDLYKLLLS